MIVEKNNQYPAPFKREIKLIALVDLLSEIAGRDILSHSLHYGRDAEAHIAGAPATFGRIRELLERCQSRREDERRIWPPLWLPIRRETFSELAACYPDSTEEEIKDFYCFHFPQEEIWLRLEFYTEEGRLGLNLAPLLFHVAVSCNTGLVTVNGGVNDQFEAPFKLFSDWLFYRISKEIYLYLADPQRYRQSLENRIPLSERFVTVRRHQFWQALPDQEHYIVDEMTPDERDEFQDVVCRLSEKVVRSNTPLSEFSAADYFRCCAKCFDAVGLADDDRGLSPRERYQKHADGRDGGLLNLPEKSSEAFLKWVSSSEWHGTHPWEIRRGGNDTHISLSAFAESGGIRLLLAGSATTRAAETMKMALALWRAGIPFGLHDADLHLRRVRGDDLVGIYPDSYGLNGRYFFSRNIDLTDCYPWGDYVDLQQIRAVVQPLALDL